MAAARLATLDGLRGVAAIVVLIIHMSEMGLASGFRYGLFAVDLFFAISGWVIAAAYERRIAAGMTFGEFARIRVIRLYPMYAVGSLLYVGLLLAWGVGSWPDFVIDLAAGALMLPSFSANTEAQFFPLNGPAWSLFFELLVNAAFFWFAPRLSVQRLALVVGVLGAACGVYYYSGGDLNGGWEWPTAHVGLLRSAFGFSAGVLLFRLHSAGRLPRVPLPAWLLLPLPLVLFVAPHDYGLTGRSAYLLTFFSMPLLVWVAAQNEPRKVLRSSCQVLGEISYPLYALHWPLIQILLALGSPTPTITGLFFFGMIVLAYLAACYIDKPTQATLKDAVLKEATPP